MNTFWKKLMFLPMLEEDGGGGTGGEPGGNTDPAGGTENNDSAKTFTQEDLNRIAAQEKRQGVSSVLKALGFEKEDDAKAFVEKYRKEENDKKDDLTKVKDDLKAEKKAKEEAEKKADLIEKKFKVVSMGVSADKADDLVILAMAKAVDGKSFDDAVEDLKKAYPEMFKGQESSGGTGTGGTPPRGGIGGKPGESLGKRLAEQKRTSTQNKSKSYFSN